MSNVRSRRQRMGHLALHIVERHLLAVIAEDSDYEPLLIINAFMSVRFGSRGYPKAVFRALEVLHSLGLISVHRYVPSGKGENGHYALRSLPRWRSSWEQQNLRFSATRSGRNLITQHARSET
jgi:hypothetical protein